MKRKTTTILAVASLGIGAAQAASIAWDGSNNFWDNATSWGGAVPTINDGTDDAVIPSGSVTYRNNPSGDLNFYQGSDLIISGGNLGQNAGYWMRFQNSSFFSITNGGSLSGPSYMEVRGFGSGSTFTIDNGTWTTGRLSADDHKIFNVTNNSTVNLSASGSSWLENASAFNITESIVSFRDLELRSYLSGDTFVNIFAGGRLNLDATSTGVSSADVLQVVDNSMVNLATIGTSSVFIDGVSTTDVEAMITGGEFGKLGTKDTSLGSYSYVTSGSGVLITAIPEPSSTALLGLGGLALILRRRK